MKSSHRGYEAPGGSRSLPFVFTALVQTKCQAEASARDAQLGRFRPQCDENGDYLPKQCFAATGYCWCSYKNGTRIEGTATREKLDCLGRSPGRGRRRGTSRVCACYPRLACD